MRSTRRSSVLRAVLLVPAAILSLDLAVATAGAQPLSPPTASWRTMTRAQIDSARADSLVACAETLQVSPGRAGGYFALARLYRRAAELRGDDSAAVGNWRLAAWSYSAGGDNGVALMMMKRAAESAMRVGDVERAIGSLVDASLIAVEAGRIDQLAPLLHRADALLASPLLPADRRTELLRRIGSAPSLAAAMRE